MSGAAESSSTSPYKTLDSASKEIRLLVIEPGPKSSTISCSLLHTSVTAEAPTKYEAASYCWGDPTNPKTILLEGHKIEITSNAEAALRNFRRADKARIVWLDAICINQQDLVERGAQVAIMKDIYVSATRTLVWLGEDDGTFNLAVELITALSVR